MSKGRGGREELPTLRAFRVEEVFPGEGLKPGGGADINLEEWEGGAERGPQRELGEQRPEAREHVTSCRN